MDIFCKIVNGEIPSYTLYEDDVVKVFLDVNPGVNGHTLIVPKEHYLNLYDIPDEVLLHIIGVARKIGPMLEEKLNADGLTLVQNNGEVQEVKHYHLHLRPQFKVKQELKPIEEIYEILTK